MASPPDFLESVFEFFCESCGRSLGKYELLDRDGALVFVFEEIRGPVTAEGIPVRNRASSPELAVRAGPRGPRTQAGLYPEQRSDGSPALRVRCGCGHSRIYRVDGLPRLIGQARAKRVWL